MLAAGVLYSCSSFNPLLLHAVNLCLALNWVGDSLDGTLARYRNRQRPRYGFYVDHILDTFSNSVVWRGWAEHRIEDMLDDPQLVRRRVRDAVHRMMERLPLAVMTRSRAQAQEVTP